MALSMERLTEFAGAYPARGSYPIKANVKIYKGAMVALDSSGNAQPAGVASGGSVLVMGKASATYNNLGGSAGAMDVEVEFGVFAWVDDDGNMGDGSVGYPVYAVDDQSVSADSAGDTQVIAGLLVEVRDGKPYVYMGPHARAIAAALAFALV